MAKKAENVAEQQNVEELDALFPGEANSPLKQDGVNFDSDLWSNAEDVSSSDREFNEFFKFQNVGDSYTGRFKGIVKPEGFEDPIALFEDYPTKGYVNVSALSVTYSIDKAFADLNPKDVSEYVYRITYHQEKEAKKGTYKDLRIQRAKV